VRSASASGRPPTLVSSETIEDAPVLVDNATPQGERTWPDIHGRQHDRPIANAWSDKVAFAQVRFAKRALVERHTEAVALLTDLDNLHLALTSAVTSLP